MITRNDVIESEVHRFIADASDLRLRPGEWPTTLDTNLGNGRPFLASMKKVDDGDLIYVRYVQEFGCITLIVFND